jgi:hypothetical protein
VNVFQHPTRVFEAVEQRPVPSLLPWRKELVLACNVPRVFCEPVSAKDFTSDWANEFPVRSVIGSAKQSKQFA